MKTKIRYKLTSCLLAAAMVFGTLSFSTTTKAAEISTADWQTCTAYNGNNIDAQNYSRSAVPIQSYLSVCPDGNLMRVQYGSSMEGILVEYYNDSYQVLSSQLIPEELPIFGGFYESQQYYFLLTGQKNPGESKDVEVYRITKYDKDWKRLGSVGLCDCNTTLPFRAGSARMDTVGDYLVIRTCHEMYQSSDGLNHQANVTIQLDMERMQITDSFTRISNSSYGYISHSFNQFIKVENNRIIGVDHGDAHPRSIALIQYPNDISGGSFAPSYPNDCTVTNVLTFPGAVGENETGASVGGFEISDSAYLVAGNSVVQDNKNLSRTTRNVFAAAVNKSTNEVTMHWLTDYEEGDGTTSTPHMVKISSNEFLLLWSRNHSVFYTKIDGNGEQIGKTYEMEGNLSDCVPIVLQDKLVWYTWSNGTITFYSIDLNYLFETETKVIENGHKFEHQKSVTDGIATLKCTHCGITEEIKVITDMWLLWSTTGSLGSYSSAFGSSRNVGDILYYRISNMTPTDADNKEMEIDISNPSMLDWTKTSNTTGSFSILKPGTTTVAFYPKYNPEVTQKFTIVVKRETTTELQADDFVFSPPDHLVYDGTAKVARIEAKDSLTGIGNITLKYYDFDGSQLSHAPIDAGVYTVKIDVSAGTEYDETSDITDPSWKFTIKHASMPAEPEDTINASHALNVVGDILLPENWKWQDSDKDSVLLPETSITATAEYTGTDGKYTTKQITIFIDTHTGGTAACTQTAVCDICFQPYGDINPQNHDYAPLVTDEAFAFAASCTDNTRYYYSCTNCGYVQNETNAKTFEIENSAFGHTIITDSAVSATCTATGLTEGSHCSSCLQIITAQKKVPALGHNYVNQVCSRCGDKQDTTPPAPNEPSIGWQTCTTYNGNNIDAQNYSSTANPIQSYLSVGPDGNLMRVQYGSSLEGILVEYYNDSYQVVSSQLIPEELPIFGGFYESQQYYFLLTGQKNPDESEDVEVYRITKYDKDWQRLGSVGLCDCNTTVPFRAGSARMDSVGDYLVIRTCHEMYQSSDGLNHQANVTIQLDMERMQITDSLTGAMNDSYGYVSHSFNQFIKAENNRIIGVDHGDAYPRSIVLIQYPNDISGGSFTPSYPNDCTVTDVLAFPGAIGNNTTGASVGGFEISDSAYLVAGNSVVQDNKNLSRTTRNVFAAAVNKSTNEVTMHWLTDYEEGDGTTSTPHMIKISSNEFLLLWSRNHSVFYTKIDGNGEQIGETYEMAGDLSDCVPVVLQDKLIWYTWYSKTVTFYTIDLNHLSETETKIFENGHEYEPQDSVTDGFVTLKCIHCGTTKKTKVITDMWVYWNTAEIGTYSTAFDSSRNVGDTLYYWVNSITPADAYNKELKIDISNPSMLDWTKTTNTRGSFTILKPGTTTVTFYPKYNPKVTRKFTIVVKGETTTELQADDFVFSPPDHLVYDGTAKLASIKAKDSLTGIGTITIKYYDSNGRQLSRAPIAAGTYTVKIDVSAGTEYGEVSDLTDSSWTFTIQEASMPTELAETMNASHALDTVGDILLPENWEWQDSDKLIPLSPGTIITAAAKYTGTDGNYNTKQITISIDTHTGGTASCTQPAVCDICSQPYGDLNPQNHNYAALVTDSAVSATCTTTGLTEGSHCSNCLQIITAQQTVPALGHYYVNQVCSRCGDKQENSPSTPSTPTMPPESDTDSDSDDEPKIETVLTDETSGALYVVTDDDTVDYQKPKDGASIVIIPSNVTLNGITYQVTGIAPNAFLNNTTVTKVTTSDQLLTVGSNAFSGCTKLKQVTIGKNVTKIEDRAFYKIKSLKKVIIKTKKLTKKTVGKQAFLGIHAKAKIKVPSNKRAAYKKILKARGIKGKKQKIS